MKRDDVTYREAMMRLTEADRQRVRRLAVWIYATNGRWETGAIDALAKEWPTPVALYEWRRDCAAALDRLVAEGFDDPEAKLRAAIRFEKERRRSTNARPLAPHWWFENGGYLLSRPEDASPTGRVQLDEVMRQARESAAQELEGM